MPLLGYPRWREFAEAVERAKSSYVAQNGQESLEEHFLGLTPKNSKSRGRPKQDYKLSRYACYLVAMNGDPRKYKVSRWTSLVKSAIASQK